MVWRNPVFLISLAICLPVGAWGVASPDSMTRAAVGFTDFAMSGATWYWLMLCTGFVVLSGFLALGPYGRVRLGADDERPEFSTMSWIAMLFAGGMGAGLLFWGVAEPISHFASPPVQPGGTAEAAREAMVITNLHWGFHAWSIYGVCALVIAYFGFRKGKGTMISTPIQALRAEGAGDIIVICGGVIPHQDYEFLKAAGVKAIFGPGTNIPTAARDILDLIRAARRPEAAE